MIPDLDGKVGFILMDLWDQQNRTVASLRSRDYSKDNLKWHQITGDLYRLL
jgi:hypothetical protein